MVDTNKKTYKLYNFLYAFTVFLIIYCSHDTILFGTNGNNTFILIRKISVFVILFLLFLCKKKFVFKFTLKDLLIYSAFALLPIFSCIINSEEINNYIYRFLIIVDAFVLVSLNKDYDFIDVFNKIILLLSYWSLAFWLVSTLFPSFPNLFPRITNSTGQSFPNFIFSTVDSDPRYIFSYRNSGIFREPGVFACILSISVLFELYRNKTSFKRIFIYLFTMITTFSTAGIIVAVILFGYCILFTNKFSRNDKIAICSVCLFAFAFVLTFGWKYIEATGIFDKFKMGTNSYGSWYSRMQSVYGNLRILKEHPIFGIGRYHLYDTVLASSGNYIVFDNTNTFLINFSAFGFLYGLLCLIGALKFFTNKRNGWFAAFVAAMILFVSLSNEDLGQNIVYFYIIFDGLLELKQKTKKKCKEECLING